MNYQEMSDEQIEFAVSDALGIPRGDKWCSDWAVSGPIISRKEISIIFHWNDAGIHGAVPKFPARYYEDSNPLRAAMIVFLMMEGGE